jgi:transposase
MKVLIGVDPHKASLSPSLRSTKPQASSSSVPASRKTAPDREPSNALSETVLRASLGRREQRRRPRGRHLAGRLVGSGESVVDVAPKLSARVRVLSSFAGNARKNDELDALATALAASRNERLPAVDPEAASEVLRLLSERRLWTWWPSAPGR